MWGSEDSFKIGIGTIIFGTHFINRILPEKRSASGVFLMDFGDPKSICKMVWIARHSFSA